MPETNYPNSVDTFVNPNPEDSTVSVDHAAQHRKLNDAVKALQQKMGTNNSADTATVEFKVNKILSPTPSVGASLSLAPVTNLATNLVTILASGLNTTNGQVNALTPVVNATATKVDSIEAQLKAKGILS